MKLLIALATLLLVFSAASDTHACGGLFCNQSFPVVQNAERILFVDNGDGTITAVIEVVYSGPSTSFAWVLPVSGVPDVSVGSTALLNFLDNATRPSLVPRYAFPGCGGGGGGCSCGGCGGASSPTSVYGSVDTTGVPSVTVLGGGSAGPYEYTVIAVDPLAADQAETARVWLNTNGYDVTTAGAALLGEYLAAGQNLIAFKLHKTASAGSIRPIVMRYASTVGVIPIKPTAVAALNDMGVLVFMAGTSRAVPVSYDEIELSVTAIDWTSAGPSYPSAVADAVDEAGGHAFVTESAGPFTTRLSLAAAQARADLTFLRSFGSTADGWPMADFARRQFRDASNAPIEGLADALVSNLSTITNVNVSRYLACPECYPQNGAVDGFDADRFVDDLDAYVVTPLEVAEALVARMPYLTRLYTSLDPLEMTVDPVFAFAPGLPNVSNQTTVDAIMSCGGTLLDVTRPGWPTYDPRRLSPSAPTFVRRLHYQLDGSMTVVTDNTDVLRAAMSEAASPSSHFESCNAASNDGSPIVIWSLGIFALTLAVRHLRRPRQA